MSNLVGPRLQIRGWENQTLLLGEPDKGMGKRPKKKKEKKREIAERKGGLTRKKQWALLLLKSQLSLNEKR
jgi:hypothetical protein